jgi:hypothetical protein
MAGVTIDLSLTCSAASPGLRDPSLFGQPDSFSFGIRNRKELDARLSRKGLLASKAL